MLVAAVVFIAVAPVGNEAQARTTPPTTTVPVAAQTPPAAALTVAGARQIVVSVNQLATRSPMSLAAAIDSIVQSSGGSVGIALIELGGSTPITWSYNGDAIFTAASTYKLVAMMMEAQNIASGAVDAYGLVCYSDADFEPGWFDDYSDGACYTRTELAQRAGLYSDNTAGHMLVRDVGGADALNAWAAAAGATGSVFATDNTTTASDLATLWAAEAKGSLGGQTAQAWLYPMLVGTATEAGIPAGVGGSTAVAHKTGQIDQVVNDAALVISGPRGAFVLTVMTDGIGGTGAWQLIASVSSEVWTFEAARA